MGLGPNFLTGGAIIFLKFDRPRTWPSPSVPTGGASIGSRAGADGWNVLVTS